MKSNLGHLNEFLTKSNLSVVERNGLLCLAPGNGDLMVLDRPWTRQRFVLNERRMLTRMEPGGSVIAAKQREDVDSRAVAYEYLKQIKDGTFITRQALSPLIAGFISGVKASGGVEKRDLEALKGVLAFVLDENIDVAANIHGDALRANVRRFLSILTRVIQATGDIVKPGHLSTVMRGV